jgi:hypothetical protein
LRVKPKLGYKLLATAYLYKYRLLFYWMKEDNSDDKNNKRSKNNNGAKTRVHWMKVDETIT